MTLGNVDKAYKKRQTDEKMKQVKQNKVKIIREYDRQNLELSKKLARDYYIAFNDDEMKSVIPDNNARQDFMKNAYKEILNKKIRPEHYVLQNKGVLTR